MGMNIQRLCVFCGSREGKGSSYVEAAKALGKYLATQKIGLVYGGASVGLMGTLADAVIEHGGHVAGVIPETLAKKEIQHPKAQEMYVVDSMHTRKAKMASLSDAFLAMPGGYGTLEELFEVITWGQLGIHRKPIGLLNLNGYYDALLAMIDNMVEEEFLPADYRDLFVSEPHHENVLNRMKVMEPPASILQWMGIEES